MKRRKFIKTSAGLLAIPVLTGVYSWQVEPFWLEFVHAPMVLKNLPDKLVGKTLMQISDLHVGNRFPLSYLHKSLKKAQGFAPDIVVYTGDFVSYENEEQFDQLRNVMKDIVKGRLGTFAILGNHDYGKNWNQPQVAMEIVGILAENNIRVLRNEHIDLEGVQLVGIDDFWGTNYNPEGLFTNEADAGRIVLCHNPDVADEPIWEGVEGWILSGHTHGGQVKPPFLDPPMLPVKNTNYSAGKYEVNEGLQMYINRALGHLWQLRFNVRPEITIFTLNQL